MESSWRMETLFRKNMAGRNRNVPAMSNVKLKMFQHLKLHIGQERAAGSITYVGLVRTT